MAKKKVTHQDKQPNSEEEEEQTHQAAAMDDASEKLQRLKSLNSILLKETTEKRKQLDSLRQEKGSLESELTRSETERGVLQGELTHLQDGIARLELERNLVSEFVSVQVNQQVEVIAEERNGLVRERAEIEGRLQNLEREMREVVREKSGIEKAKRERESKIGLLEKKLSELLVEIEKERDVSKHLWQERDVVRTELDVQIEETNGLKAELVETVKRERKIREEFQKLEREYNGLMVEKEERERRIESMTRDMEAIERSLVEANRVIEELKGEIERIVREREGIEEERNVEARKKIELESFVSELKKMLLLLQKKEERLRVNVAELEKWCVEGVEKEKKMVMEIDVLVDEKKKREKSFESLIEEKGVIVKDLDEALKQLDYQKQMLDEIVREKIEIDEVKVSRESEIVEMQKETAKLRNVVSVLEESSKDQVKKNGQLQSEVIKYRDVLNLVTIERDETRKGLDEEKMNGTRLRAKILELENNIEESHKTVGQVKDENCSLTREKEELQSRCTMLMDEIASLKNTLSKTQKDFDDMQAKVEVADCISELALNMLRNTASLVRQIKDEGGVMEESLLNNEEKVGEEMEPYAAELEAIKNSFKNRESRVEDLKRQVEFLQNAVGEAHKKKSFWTLVSSATTIFAAAASVAYIARGR
ncbi:uncharacterized protein LOC132294668 [Cornus florida]|uniref:uncharacterized protein LOC132294668 n=1 Tax=Cornus florida TaxID=4283 RepID=UPI00289D73A5|nr:uncharacterized protein LOC132294668 [Cornus florida]